MKKLAILLVLAIPSLAWAAVTYTDTWPRIGTNQQLDALRCYGLAFGAPATDQHAGYSCSHLVCTATVEVPFLGGRSTLRLTMANGDTWGTITTSGGTELADVNISPSGAFYVGRLSSAPGETPLAQCTYPRVAPVGKVARFYGNVF